MRVGVGEGGCWCGVRVGVGVGWVLVWGESQHGVSVGVG